MARLADDWPEQRQVCIDVLCAYLRIPYEPAPNAAGSRTGEREVHLTIIRTIRDPLLQPVPPTTWCGYDLGFTEATFSDGNVTLRNATFSGGISFKAAAFSGGTVSSTLGSGPGTRMPCSLCA
ncbi:pentapeptide repeat-containing protein [Streptomyces sp. KL118A]|uniref:pentapeptide repeat-containing protein n=1 Tax=Streptomyces sp. KL118A TaxID=3045153 RepID=UPI00278BE332|nr:pentapeptide repeat-containing protein [Streptomyces sp. KL118A]